MKYLEGDKQPLTSVELSDLFDQAAAEVMQESRYGRPEDLQCIGNQEAKGTNPLFGTDTWLAQLVLRLLSRVAEDFRKIEARERLLGLAAIDCDKYVHLKIPKRHRKLHRVLEALIVSHPWVGAVIDPDTEEKALIVIAALRSIGIEANGLVRLRDLNEEREFP
jgi:hypothetical protein